MWSILQSNDQYYKKFHVIKNMAESDMINGSTKVSNLENEQKVIDKAPFCHLKISDAQILDTIEGREICGRCYRSRKFFCYSCYVPVIDEKFFPRVKVS